jgi:hypothetical protein
MRRKRWAILLGGLLVLVLGGLSLPLLNGMYVSAGHRQSVGFDQPPAQAGVPASATADPALSSSVPSTVGPVAPTSRAEATVPSLQILSPTTGESVDAPFTVRYLISGIDAQTLAKLNIRLTIGNPASYTTMLAISGLEGRATVPDDKMISGRRDLVFNLARADGAPLAGSPAAVVVSGVTISGRR